MGRRLDKQQLRGAGAQDTARPPRPARQGSLEASADQVVKLAETAQHGRHQQPRRSFIALLLSQAIFFDESIEAFGNAIDRSTNDGFIHPEREMAEVF